MVSNLDPVDAYEFNRENKRVREKTKAEVVMEHLTDE
jgi:hypothetical protein